MANPVSKFVAKVLGVGSSNATQNTDPWWRVEYVDNPNHRCCGGMFTRSVQAPTQQAAEEKVKRIAGGYITIDRCIQL